MKRILEKNPNSEEYWNETIIKTGWLEKNYNHPCQDLAWEIIRHIEYGNSVLDVGAGSGMITRRIKELRPNLHISACDFSRPAVDWLKSKIPLNEVFWCDITNGIEKPNKSYDIVVCTEVLEHLDNPQKAINELMRITRKKVIVSVPFGETQSKKSAEHIWSFSLDDIFDLFKGYGMVYLTVAAGNSNIVAVCNIK